MKKAKGAGRGLYFGRVTFSGYGGFQEKLVSQLLSECVPLRGVTFSQGIMCAQVSPADYLYVSRAALKHGVRLRAEERRGAYFTLSRYSRRIGLYLGFLAFVLILSFHASRVESITVEGAPRAAVMSVLSECGIEKGVPRAGLATDRAEYLLMTRRENTAWVDVSCVGSHVTVRVEQGKEVPEIEDNASPRNLVAARAAVIVGQTVRKGRAALAAGSGVQQGGLLVSGVVADGGDHVLYVRADAEIIGEFTETQEFFVPFRETIQRADGEQRIYKSLLLHDDEYPLYFGKKDVAGGVYSEETALVRLFGQETPFRIKTAVCTAYRSIDITRTADDCTQELRRQKAACEENFYGGYEIAAAEEKFFPEKDGIRLVVDYTLRGDIAVPQVIERG